MLTKVWSQSLGETCISGRGGGKCVSGRELPTKIICTKKIRCCWIGRTRLKNQGRILWQVRAFLSDTSDICHRWITVLGPATYMSADNLWNSYTVTDGSCNKLMKCPDIHILQNQSCAWRHTNLIANNLKWSRGDVNRTTSKTGSSATKCRKILWLPSSLGSGSSVGIATGYRLDGPCIESRWGGGEIFRTCPYRPWGPPSLLYNGYRVFPGVKSGRGVTLSPHPLPVPWSWKGRAIPLLPL